MKGTSYVLKTTTAALLLQSGGAGDTMKNRVSKDVTRHTNQQIRNLVISQNHMILEKTLRWTVIAAISLLTLIPFLVPSSLFFPFITGKNFTFRILVEIMAA